MAAEEKDAKGVVFPSKIEEDVEDDFDSDLCAEL